MIKHNTKITNVLKINHEQWLDLRMKGIGGSDAGTILGVNPYKTPFQLWEEKTTGKRSTSGEAAYWGNTLEPVVAAEFAKRNDKKVRNCNFILQHKDHEFMIANIDRSVVGEDAILECKTTSAFKAGDWSSEEIPASYIIQCQHYLAVTGADKCYIACLIGGQKYIDKEIQRDNEFIEFLIQEEAKFWECVKNNTPPADTPAYEIYTKDNGETIELDLLTDLELWDAIIEEEKDLKERKEAIKINIQNKMQDNQVATFLNRKVTWKTQVTKRFDSTTFKKEDPATYEKYIKESETRVFKVK